jgi:CBS domain-containing protein
MTQRTVLEIRPQLSVGDVMHRGTITCRPDLSGAAVARIMAAHGIHAVVVAGERALPRLVTDTEVAEALYADTLETTTAAELAKPSPLVRPSDNLTYALERMHESRSTHVVVADRSLRLVGVVSVLDVIEATAVS